MSNTMEGFKELTFFIFVVVFFGVCGEACDNDLTSKSAAVRLSNDLLCGYNKNVRPVVNQSKQINVNMTIFLRNIYMDDAWEVMTVSFHLIMRWKDEFLNWDPSKYENIKNVYEYSDLIWIPDIISLNAGIRGIDTNDFSYFLPQSMVQIFYDGTISYKHIVTLHAQCSTNIAEWPYDSHNCTFFIGSPLYTMNYVNYSLPEENIINMISHSSNREWALNSVQKKCENIYPPKYNISLCFLQLKLNVERFSSMYHSTVIIPTVVISLMRTFTFLMGRETSLRITLLCLFFISELLYIQFLDEKIPNNGENSVYIVLLCRNSLILTAVALIMSVISNELYKRSTEDFPRDGPEWAKNLIKLLLNKKAISLLTNFNTQGAELLIENNVEEDTLNSQRDEKALFWKTLYILLDRLFFLITLIFSFTNFLYWIL